MYIWEATPTIDDFDSIDWQGLISSSQERTCRAYRDIFHKHMREADDSSRDVHVFAQLAYVCDLNLRVDSPDSPFGDFMGNEVKLTQEQGEVLRNLLPKIQDAEFRARISDILWVQRIGEFFPTAQTAVRAYLESATTLEDPLEWTDCEKRINRALQIALSLGQNNNALFQEVIEHIESLLDKYQGQDPLFLSARLLQHLYDVGQGDPAKYAALAESIATASASQTGDINWLRVRTYWELASKWLSRNGDETNSRQALENAAETHVKEAESLPAGYPQRSAVAARHIQSAIEAYMRITGTETRREELHRTLLAYQSQSVSDLGTVSSQIDLSDLVQQAIDEVKGKAFPDAIFSLAFIASSPRKVSLRQLTEERSKKYGLWYWISVTQLDSQGRTTATRPGLRDDPEATIRAEMFREAMHQQNIIALGIVRPSVSQINMEHYYEEQDFLRFLCNNPFIPPGREMIYARGLCAGLRGDMAVAIHLLIPQLENSLRYVLQSHGHITSGLDDDQIQDEFTLQKLLYTFKEQLEDILGEDLLFDLQGLLTERFGSNLRNLMAHGLLAGAQFLTAHMLYLWWLTLRMCCLPIYVQTEEEANPDTDGNIPVG